MFFFVSFFLYLSSYLRISFDASIYANVIKFRQIAIVDV